MPIIFGGVSGHPYFMNKINHTNLWNIIKDLLVVRVRARKSRHPCPLSCTSTWHALDIEPRGHSSPLLGQLQVATNFVNGRSRSPPLFFPSAAFNPARAPLYYVRKQGGETGPGEGDLASPALSWQGSSTPPVRDLPRPDDHHQTIWRPEEDHQTTRSPPDYLNNFPKQLLEPLACGTLANMKTRLADKRWIGWKPFRGFQKGAIFDQAAVNSQGKRLLKYNPDDIGEQFEHQASNSTNFSIQWQWFKRDPMSKPWTFEVDTDKLQIPEIAAKCS